MPILSVVLLVFALALVSLGAAFQRLKRASLVDPRSTEDSPTGEVQTWNAPIPSRPSLNSIPDFALTVFETKTDAGAQGNQSFAVGSSRGTSHIDSGVSREDSYSVFFLHQSVVMVLCDGVSGASESHIGSSFAAQNFERLLKEEFPEEISPEIARWQNINRRVSQGLVGLYRSRAVKNETELPPELSELRLAAAAAFATTLEVLVCERQTKANPRPRFTYVRLAGDGSLFQVSTSGVEKLFPISGSPDAVKTPYVSALPVFDGEPFIFSDQLSPGSALVMTTDGVGDHILNSSTWKAELQHMCGLAFMSHVDLLSLLQAEFKEAMDDRTVAIARWMA